MGQRTAKEKMRKLTPAEWRDKAVALFGNDPMKWRFVCPSCGHEASVEDGGMP